MSRYSDLAGMPPKLATVADVSIHGEPKDAPPQINGRRSSSTHGRHGMNLPAVAEVLERYGIDPAEEIVNVLKGGQLAPKDHALLASELLQYTRPKMRAVEVTQKAPELTDEQIDRRLQMLLDATKSKSE